MMVLDMVICQSEFFSLVGSHYPNGEKEHTVFQIMRYSYFYIFVFYVEKRGLLSFLTIILLLGLVLPALSKEVAFLFFSF